MLIFQRTSVAFLEVIGVGLGDRCDLFGLGPAFFAPRTGRFCDKGKQRRSRGKRRGSVCYYKEENRVFGEARKKRSCVYRLSTRKFCVLRKKRVTVGGRENKAFSRTRGQRPPTRRRAQAQKTGFNNNKKRVTFGERENKAFSRTRRQRRPKRPRAKKDKI